MYILFTVILWKSKWFTPGCFEILKIRRYGDYLCVIYKYLLNTTNDIAFAVDPQKSRIGGRIRLSLSATMKSYRLVESTSSVVLFDFIYSSETKVNTYYNSSTISS